MRKIGFMVEKEFRQIFRNRNMLPILFIMPFVQLLILPLAADYEIKKIGIAILDHDHSSFSRRLVEHIGSSNYFEIKSLTQSQEMAFNLLDRDKVDLFIEIPIGFEKDFLIHGSSDCQITINSINGSKAAVAQGYLLNVIQKFRHFMIDRQGVVQSSSMQGGIPEIKSRFWFNRDLDYDTLMVPGILVILITMIGSFLSGMNIVKEKESGTIEQMNVTPLKKYQFIAGKLLPFWLIGLIDLTIGLAIAILVFDIPTEGSIGLIYAFAAVYLLGVLGLGLLISTFTETQQQSMFITWFLLVIFILMSGLFTPIESMPSWAQKLTLFNPIAYFVEVMRMILLKGSDLLHVLRHFLMIGGFAFGLIFLAILNYRKTV